MKSIKIRLGIALFLLAAGWFVGASGCSDKSTNPPPPEDKDYAVYFANEYNPQYYYAYHTKTGSFDTFMLPYDNNKTGFTVSPDGTRLYLNPPGKIVEVETDSFTILAEHPLSISRDHFFTEVLVTPDSKYLVSKKTDLAIIDLADYSVVFHDESRAYWQCNLSIDGRFLYCTVVDSFTYLYCLEYDLANNFSTREWRPSGGHASRMTANHDSSIWYVYFNFTVDIGLFQMYDPDRDTVLFGKSLIAGSGDMQVTLDDQAIFVSQPGNRLMGIPGPRHFKKFSTRPPYDYEEINCITIDNDTLIAVAVPNELCMTPDGRHLIGISNIVGQFFDFDIPRGEYNRQVHISYNMILRNPICQSNR